MTDKKGKISLILEAAGTIGDREKRTFEYVHAVLDDCTTLTYFYLSEAAIQSFVKFQLDFRAAKELKIGLHNSVTFVLSKECP